MLIISQKQIFDEIEILPIDLKIKNLIIGKIAN